MSGSLVVRFLGRVPYADALEMQAGLVADRRNGEIDDTLLLLEHPPVITLGRGASEENVRLGAAELARRGIERHEVGRGGDVTYHGPGQLVGYPILALTGVQRDAHGYLRDIEEALIRTCAAFGIEGGREPGLTGVWVEGEKVAAIGVRLSTGWITSHGFALNVSTDVSGFETIVPCGIGDRGVTSLERLLGRRPELKDVAARTAVEFAAVFGRNPRPAADPAERLALPRSGPLS